MTATDIGAHGVVTSYRSGNREYRARMSRANFRRFVERSIRQLNEWEREERLNVVEMRGHG